MGWGERFFSQQCGPVEKKPETLGGNTEAMPGRSGSSYVVGYSAEALQNPGDRAI